MDLHVAGSIFDMGIWLWVHWDFFLSDLLSSFLVVYPAECQRSPFRWSPVSLKSSSLQHGGISAPSGGFDQDFLPLLNYNLPSTSLSFSPSLLFGQKNGPHSLFCCQLMCVFVCARRVHVRVKLLWLPAEGVCEMIGGVRIWSGSTGRSRAQAFTFYSPFIFFSSISWYVVMTSRLLHGSSSPFLLLQFRLRSIWRVPLFLRLLETHFHLPPSPSPTVAAFHNVICISLVFSCSVKLSNPLIKAD